MAKYALNVESLTLYVEKEERLHKGEEITVKRNEVKSWRKDEKKISKFFLRKGKSEKPRDRNVNNYEIRLTIGNEAGGSRCLEKGSDTYQGFNASLIVL